MAEQGKNRAYLFNNSEVVTDALARGVWAALEQHRRAGNDVALWRDGKVVRIGPDEIARLLEKQSGQNPDAEKSSERREKPITSTTRPAPPL